jgi:hypothetical protein
MEAPMRRSFAVVSGSVILFTLFGCASGGGGSLVGSERLLAILPQEAEASSPLRELFTGERPLVFTLEADFDQLTRDRAEDNEERPARAFLPGLAGDTLELPLKVRTRGNFRLRRDICPFPPLRLNFPSAAVEGTVLEGQDKLKLVTHCREQEFHEQNVVEELLAYRIYNELTDVGFRVQLAFITYLDTSGRNRPLSRLAFLIEDEDKMAARLDGQMLEVARAAPDQFHQRQAGIMYLFQYMIGNTDWSMAAFHNVKVMRIGTEYLPIPYDFDFSGLVNAPYAGPNPALAHLHSSVRERLYRGFCSDRIDFDEIFGLYQDKREPILEMIRTQPGFSQRSVSTAVRYIEDFYRELDNPERFKGMIRQQCGR